MSLDRFEYPLGDYSGLKGRYVIVSSTIKRSFLSVPSEARS